MCALAHCYPFYKIIYHQAGAEQTLLSHQKKLKSFGNETYTLTNFTQIPYKGLHSVLSIVQISC